MVSFMWNLKQKAANKLMDTEPWLTEGRVMGESEEGEGSQIYGHRRELDFGCSAPNGVYRCHKVLPLKFIQCY